jgi:hypothetical protein
MEKFDHVVPTHWPVVFEVFEDYYVQKVLDYSSAKGVCGLGFQG